MPHSYGYFKNEIKEHILLNVAPESQILDIGAGSGTYAHLLSGEYPHLDALEVFEPYVERFQLRSLYRKVYVASVLDFDFSGYDYLIFGDVLEHISYQDAASILDKIQNCNQRCMVAIPYLMEQGESGGNKFEIHLQPDLTHDNFLERYPQMRAVYRNEHYGYYCNYDYFHSSFESAKRRTSDILRSFE